MTDDVTHSTQYYIEYKSYLGQFAAQTIETWQANSSTGNTPMAVYVSDFQLEKCGTLGHKRELTYLYACWIMQIRHHLQT